MNWKLEIRTLCRDFDIPYKVANELILKAECIKYPTQGRTLSRMRYDYCYSHLRDYILGKKERIENHVSNY